MSSEVKRKIDAALENPLSTIRVLTATVRGWLIKLKFHILKPNNVIIGKRFRVYSKVIIRGPGKLIIGDHVSCDRTQFKHFTIITHDKSSKVVIGNGNYFGGAQISCVNRIEIGDEILTANTTIMDSDIIPNPNMVLDKEWIENNSNTVKIGNHCWLGMNSIVLKGVTLGDECVLSAGSVATKSAEPFSLLMGNSARKIGTTRETE